MLHSLNLNRSRSAERHTVIEPGLPLQSGMSTTMRRLGIFQEIYYANRDHWRRLCRPGLGGLFR